VQARPRLQLYNVFNTPQFTTLNTALTFQEDPSVPGLDNLLLTSTAHGRYVVPVNVQAPTRRVSSASRSAWISDQPARAVVRDPMARQVVRGLTATYPVATIRAARRCTMRNTCCAHVRSITGRSSRHVTQVETNVLAA